MLSSRDMERALELLVFFKKSDNEAELLTARIIEALVLEQKSSLDLYRKLEAMITQTSARQSELQAEVDKRSEALGRQASELAELRLGRVASEALEKRLQDATQLSEQRLREISELEDEKAVLEDKLHQAERRIEQLLEALNR